MAHNSMKKNQTTRFLIKAVVALSVMIVLVIISFVTLKRFDEQANERAQKLAVLEANNAAAQDFENALEQSGGIVALIKTAYVTSDDLVLFLESLETMARQNGLRPQVLAASNSVDANKEPKFVSTIEVLGSQANVLQYIRLLTTHTYHVRITAISYERFVEGGGARATISVEAFIAPESLETIIEKEL